MLLTQIVAIKQQTPEVLKALALTEDQLTFLVSLVNTLLFDGMPSAYGRNSNTSREVPASGNSQ